MEQRTPFLKIMSRTTKFNLIAVWVIPVFCLLAIYSDKDIHSISQLLTLGGMQYVGIYAVVIYLICALLFYWLEKRKDDDSISIALGFGTPGGLILVVIILNLLMGRCSA
jgi:hypothetical protein